MKGNQLSVSIDQSSLSFSMLVIRPKTFEISVKLHEVSRNKEKQISIWKQMLAFYGFYWAVVGIKNRAVCEAQMFGWGKRRELVVEAGRWREDHPCKG
jgi:hypothetical protein